MQPASIALRTHHRTRLLNEYNCNTQCPIRKVHAPGGFETYLSNRLDDEGMLIGLSGQLAHIDIYPISYHFRHSHYVEVELLTPFPLVLSQPFEFSRQILVPLNIVVCNNDLAVANLDYAVAHVRDPFITWVEHPMLYR